MRFVPRHLADELLRASRQFSAVLMTGPRRSGKTTLLRKLFPRADYYLLEDPDVVARVRTDPRSFLDGVRLPVIMDEIQNTPELFNYIRTRIDRGPRPARGQWLLTGSQEASLMENVTESMAGRAAVLHMLPLSTRESGRVSLRLGGFPEVLARPQGAERWFRSYVQTYLERDVRAVTAIRDLATFRRFLALLASRCGQMLNRAALAAPLGVSVPTISQWLSVLEITGQILLVPPFFENFGKRLVKSPKLYFIDSGLACHLLGIDSQTALDRSPFLGPLFEGFVASEIVKQQANSGRRSEIYCFRDERGLEVDFVLVPRARELTLIEAKASRTVTPAMALPLTRLAESSKSYKTSCLVVHRGGADSQALTALLPGVAAVTLAQALERVSKTRRPRRR
ncbi:MAG: DUF4143 domain-containing protein [Luteitalea sp.]|nr:DUF4143 domain-containing protein [Luteitalea sp.]